MRFVLVFLLTTLVAQYIFAQAAPIKIVLKNDSVILTNYAYLTNSFTFKTRKPHVIIDYKDGPRITIDRIDHVEGNDKTGKFRYFGVATFQGTQIFAERIHDGERVDLYLNNVITGGWDYHYSTKLLHYSKDGGEIKKARYPNLRKDLRDSPEAMKKLRGGNAIKISQYLIYGLGAFVLVKTAKDDLDKPQGPPGTDTGVPSGFIIGAGILFVPWIINGLKLKEYEKACKAYQ